VGILRIAVRIIKISWRAITRAMKFGLYALLLAAVIMVSGNLFFHAPRTVPHRALSPNAAACKDGSDKGWRVLAESKGGQVPNDELSAIGVRGEEWRAKFACVVQRHVMPGYRASDGSIRDLTYDFGFIEFREDGKPYALREPCDPTKERYCQEEGYGPVRLSSKTQLDAVLASLGSAGPHYVMVFVHGWRNDASIGNANVAEFREYAAHVARFIEDRAALNPSHQKPHLTAIFVGWRGARTDETWLRKKFGAIGEWFGDFFAILTLFDRKPVSETIAPAVLAGLRAIESKLGLSRQIPTLDFIPRDNTNKMIVFGHSLGGNLLITALRDDLVKKVDLHKPGTYMQPVLGDLVVLINPAAEASKWIDIQRAVWEHLAMSDAERRTADEYRASHEYFRQDQAPLVVSVTAARDWPPGGRRETDCFSLSSKTIEEEANSRTVLSEGFQYDWATYDLFPLFKGDLRPLADTVERLSLGVDPHDACDKTPVSLIRRIGTYPAVWLSWLLRVLPFMQTDPEQTRTIGHIDPPRAPRGTLEQDYFTGHPFGTTHELRGIDPANQRVVRRTTGKGSISTEVPLKYEEVTSREAACPTATAWLLRARQETERRYGGHGTFWDSACAGSHAPALEFKHGFRGAGTAPITRANDPFWNVRAFDTALARHDGYMLSSFICAMNQLVLDDPGGISHDEVAGAAGDASSSLTTPGPTSDCPEM